MTSELTAERERGIGSRPDDNLSRGWRPALGIVLELTLMLVPSLLLVREIASVAPTTAPPPEFTVVSFSSLKPTDPGLSIELTVVILDDGYRLITHEGQRANETRERFIPLSGGASSEHERHDYAALENVARELEFLYHDETVVSIRIETDVSMRVLIDTMDALRGSACQLPVDATPIPEECFFFRPVIEAG